MFIIAPHETRPRRGFTLILIAVSLMIVATLAVTMLPHTFQADRQIAAARTAQIFRTLELNLTNATAANGATGFCTRVTICPQRLYHLTTQITGSDRACGGANYTSGKKNTQVEQWIGDGSQTFIPPYSGLPIIKDYGVWTPLGVIHDSLIRPNAARTDSIEMHIDSVSADDAAYLDLAMDATANSGAGKIKYQNTATNTSGQTMKLVRFLASVGTGKC